MGIYAASSVEIYVLSDVDIYAASSVEIYVLSDVDIYVGSSVVTVYKYLPTLGAHI